MMMMMMMNCFCDMADSLIFSRDLFQRSSPSRISSMPLAGFEPAQNLSSGLVEWCWAVVITTTPHHNFSVCFSKYMFEVKNYKKNSKKQRKLKKMFPPANVCFPMWSTEWKCKQISKKKTFFWRKFPLWKCLWVPHRSFIFYCRFIEAC